MSHFGQSFCEKESVILTVPLSSMPAAKSRTQGNAGGVAPPLRVR